MKYQKITFNKIDMIEADNENGLKIIVSPIGAALRSIVFNDEEMLVTPKQNSEFFEPTSALGKTSGPILKNSESRLLNINNKDYIYDEKYHMGSFIFKSNPYMDKKIFSILYSFKKKKMKDGLPGNIDYYVGYSMGPSDSVLLVDYRAVVSEETPVSISNNIMFSLAAKHFNELYLTVPSSLVLNENEYVQAPRELDFQKKKNCVSSEVDHTYKIKSSELPIVLESQKYRLEITLYDYDCVHINSDNGLNRGIAISPIDDPLGDNLVNKKTIYHRQVLYKFIKK